MSEGNWDDSETDSEPVEIVEKPVILPRARQPSIAKSLEKNAILESSVAGSVKDMDGDDTDDDSDSVGSAASLEGEDEMYAPISLDFDATTSMKKLISQFRSEYRNIIMEFADVEIFLINLDSLILECAAHTYHNWQHGGQTLLIAMQIERFLQHFLDLGGKFKLVVFTDFAVQFARDTTLAFTRTCAISHMASSRFGKDMVYFTSPVDVAWEKFLRDITPSFLMISTENVPQELCAKEDVNVVPQLETIVLHVLAEGIPVVLLNSIAINFASVEAYYVNPKLVIVHNWDSFVAAHWECNSELLKAAKSPVNDLSQFKNTADFWIKIIQEAKATSCSENFDSFASAVILSALITSRRGEDRIYIPAKENTKRGLDLIKDRRNVLKTAVTFLEKADFSKCQFSFADIWDGRMVFTLFDAIVNNEEVLPYRLQEEFALYHGKAQLSKPLAVDTTDKLFEPKEQTPDPLASLPMLYSVKSPVIDQFIPEFKKAHSENIHVDGTKQDYVDWFRVNMSWKMKPIEGQFAEATVKIEDAWQQKRLNKSRQYLSRWYEMFANSLEGKGSNLLVDFSRTPKGYASAEDGNDKQKKNKGWAGQKAGGGAAAGGGKKGKEVAKSKKELILEANKKAKDNKAIEGEKTKIKYANQHGKNSVPLLVSLLSKLTLAETKALCLYEIVMRESKEIFSTLTGASNLERRRFECVDLVEHIKHCFTRHWQYLEDKQKSDIADIWVSLGFEAPPNVKVSAEAKQKKITLDSNMVYYQLKYGGQLIDILADPQKDDRVTGFNPDGWQRRMLDSVDRGHSAIIIAPTSAGKTFISYYCVEKILRASDEDVVVIVSPSKALMNQMCGSVYARFKNKSMTRGKALFGVLSGEYRTNPLNCQVLVTVPETFESLLLSVEKEVQEFVSKIKYVVFDEVHSIGASEEAHIWEHLLLTIRCPFLALSATIGNATKLHAWLANADAYKTGGKRKVDLISYGERYSELELSVVDIAKPNAITEEEISGNAVTKGTGIMRPLMPYGVYMPEKIKMFGIPDDQQLTARQILTLYQTMANYDAKAKEEFEPCHYFGYTKSLNVWISRAMLREYEQKLKERFLSWLNDGNDAADKVLKELSGDGLKEQLDHRSLPFNKVKVALENIVPLVDNMRDNQMLPAIVFSDDRFACESLAQFVATELEKREREFMETDDFKNNYAIKDEEKLLKLAKRKRDLADKKKGDKDEDRDNRDGRDNEDETDVLGAQKARLEQVLERFKLRGRGGGDREIYTKFVERLSRGAKQRESTRLLLRLFERGIGFHHAALNMVEKGAVEVLFRSGHLAILFSTSTLALGVNMPCKSVVFSVDTQVLTPLMFRQMSGRAGRRGFDHSGNVVFLSIPTSKMRRLLTASLSNLQGNPPFSVTFLLRLLSYVHQPDVIHSETGAPILTLEDRAKVAMTVLKNSFSLFTKRECNIDTLREQIKMYTGFSIQLLRHLQLLDESCNGKNLAGLVAFLPEKEVGILPFIHLLQKGALHNMIKDCNGNKDKAKSKLLLVLAHLFSRKRLPPTFNPDDKSTYPNVPGCKNFLFLPALPNNVLKCLEEYNSFTFALYHKFMAAASKNNDLLAPVYYISGQKYESKALASEDLVLPMYEGYCHDQSFLPVVDLDAHDFRGRKIYYNAYVLSMFANESRKMLHSVNQLVVSNVWFIINDFNEVIRRLSLGLDLVARPQDPLAEVMRDLHVDFDKKFRHMFGMKGKD